MIHKTLIILYAPGVCVAKICNKEVMDYITSVGPSLAQGAIDEAHPI